MNSSHCPFQIEVCKGPSCGGKYFSADIYKTLKKLSVKDSSVEVVYCGCMGKCDYSPNIKVNDTIYTKVEQNRVKEIYDKLRLEEK